MRERRRFVLVTWLVLAAGCALRPTARSPVGPNVADVMTEDDRARAAAIAAERANAARGDGYRIGPDDLLEIHIPDLLDPPVAAAPRVAPPTPGPTPVAPAPATPGLRVNASGLITIPLLGPVHAEGLTPTALEADIARRLTETRLLRTPQVSVQIAEYRSRVVAVIGSVERPGLYPLTRPQATVADLVWAAGGPTREAGRVVEFVPVAGDGAFEPGAGSPSLTPIRLDLEVLLRPTADEARRVNPQVRPGDVVSVSPAGSVLVDGWVDKPGSYPVTRGLTLSGAVAAAGGAVFAADRHGVSLQRASTSGGYRSFTVDLEAVARGETKDVPITDGDVVRLAAAPSRVVPWAVWTVVRDLVHVGGSVLLF